MPIVFEETTEEKRRLRLFPIDSVETQTNADRYIDSGGRFTCQALTAGPLVLYAEHKDADGDPDDQLHICKEKGEPTQEDLNSIVALATEWLSSQAKSGRKFSTSAVQVEKNP